MVAKRSHHSNPQTVKLLEDAQVSPIADIHEYLSSPEK